MSERSSVAYHGGSMGGAPRMVWAATTLRGWQIVPMCYFVSLWVAMAANCLSAQGAKFHRNTTGIVMFVSETEINQAQ